MSQALVILGPSLATTFPEKFAVVCSAELLLCFSSLWGRWGARRGLQGGGGSHGLPTALWGRFNSFQICRVHVSA